jgi:hypothetical protein
MTKRELREYMQVYCGHDVSERDEQFLLCWHIAQKWYREGIKKGTQEGYDRGFNKGFSHKELITKGKTMHRDWKGPGVYDCWDGAGRWNKRVWRQSGGDFIQVWTYQKLENFEPPKPPKPELPDGVYLVEEPGGPITAVRFKDGEPVKCAIEPGDEILGRIPVEPVE